VTRAEWDAEWRRAFDAAWKNGQTRSRAFDLAHKVMLQFYGPRPEAEPKPPGPSRPSRIKLLLAGLALWRLKRMNYDWKVGLAKVAKSLAILALSAVAGALAALAADPRIAEVFAQIPLIGPIVGSVVVAGLTWLANYLKNK
jgi:hypothetical protein